MRQLLVGRNYSEIYDWMSKGIRYNNWLDIQNQRLQHNGDW